MAKIGLIQPKPTDTLWNLSGTFTFSRKKALLPPLSLATVAALTPSDFEIEIIDENIEEIDFDKHYDMVGITGYHLHSSRMFEISAEFRKRGVLTIGGGPFCSAHTHDLKSHFDIMVCGEVEKVWGEFLSDWKKGEHKDFYQGEEGLDMSISPVPRWDLIKLDQYASGIVQTSRGCPYDCEFCDVVTLFGRGNRYKPLENILHEIKVLVEKGVYEFFLADDNLIGNRKFVKDLLRGLIDINKKRRSPLRFITQVTLDVAQDLEMLDLFKKANFFILFIGIETPNEESLILTDKKHNLRVEMKEAIRRIQSRGIFIFSGMIVGFDSDDTDIFHRQIQFMEDAGLTIFSIGTLIAFKGTKLWDRLEREGRLIAAPSGDLDPYIFTHTNFTPKLMTREELSDGYVGLLKKVFSYEHFLKRFQSLIDQIDLQEVKKDSPLSQTMGLRYMNFNLVLITIRVICFHLFSPDKEKRKFFFSVLKIGLSKGTICVPWIINTVYIFKSLKEFVDKNYAENTTNTRITQPPEPIPTPAEEYSLP